MKQCVLGPGKPKGDAWIIWSQLLATWGGEGERGGGKCEALASGMSECKL